MEFIGHKNRRKRNRKYNFINSFQYLDQIKLQIKSQKLNIMQRISKKQTGNINSLMDASTFWKNYKAGYEWQKT
jgi:hypothetical protein